MKDWSKFALALEELLGWFDLRGCVRCPECGETKFAPADINPNNLTMTSRGFGLPMRCDRGHDWNLGFACWRSAYPEVKGKLAAISKIWAIQDLQAEIKVRQSELERLKEKYFDERDKLQARARKRVNALSTAEGR